MRFFWIFRNSYTENQTVKVCLERFEYKVIQNKNII